ncbi:MAG: hypothetical protein LUD43_00865 [Firmicutes bacterium]|nr:hypothetical protein [Bacillota bacterium]
MKKILILILALAMCFSIVSCADSVDADEIKSADTDTTAMETENETDTTDTAKNETEETDETGYYTTCPGSIYPNAWQEMNAMVVEWGETNSETWSYRYSRMGLGTICTVEYVGVEITILNFYSETADESLINNYVADDGCSLEGLTFVMIPKMYLDNIESGSRALIFVEQLENDTDRRMGCKLGDIVVSNVGTYMIDGAPIFHIVDGEISVPEEMYEKDRGGFKISVMYYLTEGNTFMEKNYPDVDIRFEDGMTVGEFGEFVEYLCTEADGLIYP